MVHTDEMAQPTQTDPQFKLRLPDGMRDRIKAAAEANNRSMNAEIVAALESCFPEPKSAADVVSEVTEVLSMVEPGLREKAIQMISEEVKNGRLSLMAEAYAHAERDRNHRYPWEFESY